MKLNAHQTGGIFNFGGTTNVANSTFTGNEGVNGGGIFAPSGTVNVVNTTFSNNSASFAGALAASNGATMNIASSTFVNNGAETLGSVDANVMVRNSIFRADDATTHCFTVSGTPISGDYNLADDITCPNASGPAGPVTNIDETLASNGGPTQTHALLAGSNAIDTAGFDCEYIGAVPFFNAIFGGSTITTDQRGEPRAAGACDIGAFEFQLGLVSAIKSFNPAIVPVSTDASSDLTFTITNNDNDTPAINTAVIDNLPDGLTLATVPPAFGGSCTSVADAGSDSDTISFSVPSIAAGSSCTVSVTIDITEPNAEATYTNSDVTVNASASGFDSTQGEPTLEVVNPLQNVAILTDPIDENEYVELYGDISYSGDDLGDVTLTVDWGDGSTPQSYPNGDFADFLLRYQYLDDDPTATSSDVYTITLTATSENGLEAKEALQVTVNNVAPTLSNVAITTPIDEGGSTTLSGSITDPGTLDTFSLVVDWGDGTTPQTFPYVAGTTTFSETHTYADDGVFTVNLSLTDDDSTTPDTDSVLITVNNVVPALSNVEIDTPINENDTATLTGTIADPGSDALTLVVDWGDGSTPETFTYEAGTTSFSETHQYLDDNPTATTSDVYTVGLTLSDDGVTPDTDSVTITVNNLAPVVEAGNNQTISEGGSVSLDPATFTDTGTLDTHTATIDWGDGSTTETGIVTQGAGSGSVAGSHIYADATGSPFTVTVTVTDDDGGTDTDTFEVTVNSGLLNIVKQFDGQNSQTIIIGQTSTLTVVVSNPNDGTPMTGITFSDSLGTAPGDLTITNPVGALAATCDANSSLTAQIDTTTSFSVTGGSIAPGESCTISITVTGNGTGAHTNQITDADAEPEGANDSNIATLTVINVQPLAVSKAFDGQTETVIALGGESTLTITLENSNLVALTGVTFTDALPSGLTPVTTGTAVGTCAPSGNSFSVDVTATQITPVSGSSFAGGDTCTVDIDVTASSGGTYDNQITGVSATPGGVGENSNIATLQVIDILTITKDFSPARILSGGSTTLTITISNPYEQESATDVAFVDDMPAGLTIVGGSLVVEDSSTCGAVPVVDSDSVSLSGGTVPAGESCVLSVTVTATATGTYVNSFESFSSSFPEEDSTDTATLRVDREDVDDEDDADDDSDDQPAAPLPPNVNPLQDRCMLLSGGSFLTEVTPGTVAGDVFCRIINRDGEYLTNPGEIGDINLIQRGVLQAIDVFGLSDGGQAIISFNAPVKVCLRGSGELAFMTAATQPRQLQGVAAFSEGTWTCTTLANAGTLILLPGAAAPATGTGTAPAAPTAGTALASCQVTTEYIVRLRSEPNTASNASIITSLPYGLTLQAIERVPGWFRVIYLNGQGWVSADYVSTSGDC